MDRRTLVEDLSVSGTVYVDWCTSNGSCAKTAVDLDREHIVLSDTKIENDEVRMRRAQAWPIGSLELAILAGGEFHEGMDIKPGSQDIIYTDPASNLGLYRTTQDDGSTYYIFRNGSYFDNRLEFNTDEFRQIHHAVLSGTFHKTHDIQS